MMDFLIVQRSPIVTLSPTTQSGATWDLGLMVTVGWIHERSPSSAGMFSRAGRCLRICRR